MNRLRNPAVGVFVILWASYAWFWQGRDWNSASRLMLTYAWVDRGTIRLDGLDDQTRDIARYQGHWYTDKTPGYSLAAVPAYWLAKRVGHLPDHPLDRPGFAHWPADYWATVGTSGLATAFAGAILASLALRLGCGPRAAAALGLAYGLATPAAVYATLAYGHQLAAACLLGSFALMIERGRRFLLRAFIAGFAASYASVVEIQVGPVSAILGLAMIGLVLARRRSAGCLVAFTLGAAVPTALLLGYNQAAFDSPWRMGYFYLVMDRFAAVHSAANPLGLGRPDLARAGELLWGERRGLLWFAPITLLTPVGLLILAARRRWALAGAIAAILVAIFLVNLSYPEWTGGWTTGPRLLVPLLPFACLAVAPVLATGNRPAVAAAVLLVSMGGVEMLLFGGVGGRVPDAIARPLVEGVWPLWRGDPLPGWVFGQRFARTLAGRWLGKPDANLDGLAGYLQFAPLLLFQAASIATLLRWLPPAPAAQAEATRPPSATPS